MENIGYLKEVGGRFEFHFDQLGLVVRGNFAEWVLAAAAEIIRDTAIRESESRMDEVQALIEFGEASDLELDAVKFEMSARFEVLPQCIVSMGTMDYRWADKEAREKLPEEFGGHTVKRLHDMSMTRNDTFLKNENGVDTSSE